MATATTFTRFESAIGQTREVVLADGSTLTLGGASSVAVNYEQRRRHIALTNGQVMFHVAKDPARPFVVDTGSGYIRAVGTEFDVHRTLDQTTVMVAGGVVEVVAYNRLGRPQSVSVPVGMQVSFTPDGGLGPETKADPREIGNWRYGTLNFVDCPLKRVVSDLNRYSSRPIVIEDPTIAQIDVVGVVRIDRIEDWLRGLASISNVSVSPGDAGIIRLTPRPAN
jgi:transmembrane sensor